jgi:hypothetical protein
MLVNTAPALARLGQAELSYFPLALVYEASFSPPYDNKSMGANDVQCTLGVKGRNRREEACKTRIMYAGSLFKMYLQAPVVLFERKPSESILIISYVILLIVDLEQAICRLCLSCWFEIDNQ